MDLRDYKIGCPLRLDIYDDDGNNIDKNFISQMEEAVDGYEAYIAVPIVEGVVYAVRVGSMITVYMQEGNSFYRFQARVTHRFQQDGRPVMRILRLSEIDSAQRRSYYRFKCAIPFKYRAITNYRKYGDTPFTDGVTVDISGAGLCFNSGAMIEIDSLVEFELFIDDRFIYFVGQIKRCDRGAPGEPDRVCYQVGVLISEIEEHQREFIIRYIFNEERRRIQRFIA